MVVFRRIREIAVPRRRGGRPCPPAGNACFYGKPMRIRNILMGRCGHRPLHEVVFPIPYRRGRCLHRPAGNARFMVVFRRIREIAVPRRRGGRPCPPAGVVRFYGDPMRIRNVLMGRCGHRPLRTTTEKRRILRADRVVRPYKGYEKPRGFGGRMGGQGRPPLQTVLENRVWVEIPP